MKSSQLVIPTVTGILGLALGIAMAPSVRTAETGSEVPSNAAKRNYSDEADGITSEEGRRTDTPKRSRDRGEEKKPKEPQVSIPLKTMVGILKENEFANASKFDELHNTMEKALSLLGVTDREREDVLDLVDQSREEIHAAEISHLKLGEATPEKIRIDMTGMQGPAEEIAKRTQTGIRAALPADLAEGLVSAVAWEKYYPASETSAAIFLEITRSSSGRLIAWHKDIDGIGTGQPIGDNFKDDGTPLPADRVFEGLIFGDRWAPFIKGLTILPKDED